MNLNATAYTFPVAALVCELCRYKIRFNSGLRIRFAQQFGLLPCTGGGLL